MAPDGNGHYIHQLTVTDIMPIPVLSSSFINIKFRFAHKFLASRYIILSISSGVGLVCTRVFMLIFLLAKDFIITSLRPTNTREHIAKSQVSMTSAIDVKKQI